jgi:hypothetical protein
MHIQSCERTGIPGVLRINGDRWHILRARSAGICALTGNLIGRGDLVYQPLDDDSCPRVTILADIVSFRFPSNFFPAWAVH